MHTRQGEWLLKDSLARLAHLYAPQLLRIHRAVLVNVQHLSALQRDKHGRLWVGITGVAVAFAVSRRLAAGVQQALERG